MLGGGLVLRTANEVLTAAVSEAIEAYLKSERGKELLAEIVGNLKPARAPRIPKAKKPQAETEQPILVKELGATRESPRELGA